jgi:hypothetical protein
MEQRRFEFDAGPHAQLSPVGDLDAPAQQSRTAKR